MRVAAVAIENDTTEERVAEFVRCTPFVYPQTDASRD